MKNKSDVLEMLSADSEETAKRHVYKYTECGAWITFDSDGISLGSIVEGSDVDCNSYELKYPFSKKDYDDIMQAINEEASNLWAWANEEDEKTGKTPAEEGCDAPTGVSWSL